MKNEVILTSAYTLHPTAYSPSYTLHPNFIAAIPGGKKLRCQNGSIII